MLCRHPLRGRCYLIAANKWQSLVPSVRTGILSQSSICSQTEVIPFTDGNPIVVLSLFCDQKMQCVTKTHTHQFTQNEFFDSKWSQNGCPLRVLVISGNLDIFQIRKR